MTSNLPIYGQADATYQAAGGLEGITALVDRFYQRMDTLPAARILRDMHPADLTTSRQRLTWFLSGWTGGPKLYAEHVGAINIPMAHAHLPADASSVQAWLTCMDLALQDLGYPDDFRHYLMQQLARPAESIRLMCQFHAAKHTTGS
ncbi:MULTISPECIES: group II truncated hemoglobin [unclassified Oceanobacter]|uniref:group II truncated hemoglobin n=1 Tax=unclassified Oceanobacter TaxID=2620260 RepID=UPI0026FF2105|nr:MULTISPECIES: group II truncated hemoglobin [unclassified Oceanobacter]MDO6804036.1 group II truncated hemoglobin [Wenyingzhuangia sp. 1_MG-2023]MDP2609803.1 group II truncated hemoglobin [Oceanobacter sp. 1_MG-2023]MDP2613134.1 group II truncated hemoglobin [Oceanobacter sp. 2_MG-2023]